MDARRVGGALQEAMPETICLFQLSAVQETLCLLLGGIAFSRDFSRPDLCQDLAGRRFPFTPKRSELGAGLGDSGFS